MSVYNYASSHLSFHRKWKINIELTSLCTGQISLHQCHSGRLLSRTVSGSRPFMASSNTYCISPGRYQACQSGIRSHPWGHQCHHQCKSCNFCFESGCITATHSGTLKPCPALWLGWFIDNAKAFDCVDHNKLWKILQEMGLLEFLTFGEICMQVSN